METSTLKAQTQAPIEDLVRASQSGDLQAFEGLYRSLQGRVYAVCLRLTADRQLAEELTQDAFVRIWQKLGSFRGESAFTTWCHRLTVRLAIDRLRTEGRRVGWVSDAVDLDKLRPAPSPDEELRHDLETSIARLPAGARAVFVLHDVEGYRHSEIADWMGIGEGTSKAQLHRARRLLREVMQR